jgi:hypothetical protein
MDSESDQHRIPSKIKSLVSLGLLVYLGMARIGNTAPRAKQKTLLLCCGEPSLFSNCRCLQIHYLVSLVV